MPLQRKTSVFSIDEAMIYRLTADPSGGSPTYAAGVPVPGIKTMTVDKDIATAVLTGGGTVIASRSKLRRLTATVGFAQLDLDVEAILFGGTVTDSGVTPNQITSYDLLDTSQGSQFKLAARIVAVDHVAVGGDVRISLHKCTAETGGGIGGTEEVFTTPTFAVSASRLDSNKKLMTVDFRETGAVLA